MKKIYLNPLLLFCGIFYCVLCICLCVVMIFIVDADNPDRAGIIAIFAFFCVAMLTAGLLCMPRWYSYIRITKEKIEYKCAFRKAEEFLLNRYSYIYKAYYIHYTPITSGRRFYFIILSTKSLNKDELTHINKIPSSLQTIKIRYRKKTYDNLLKALSSKQSKQLRVAFADNNK